MPGALAAARAATKSDTKSKDKPKGPKAPNLGATQAIKEVGGGITGLIKLATSLAPGGESAPKVWGSFGKGLGASLAGTAVNLTDVFGSGEKLRPLVGKVFGEENAAKSPKEQYEERGILGPLIENVGNVSIAGAVPAKALSLGKVGRLAKAEATAARAAKPGATASALKEAAKAAKKAEGLTADTSKVIKRTNTLNTLYPVAHPYRSLFEGAVRPLGKAATQSLLAANAPSPPVDLIADKVGALMGEATGTAKKSSGWDGLQSMADSLGDIDDPTSSVIDAQRAAKLAQFDEPTVRIYRGGSGAGDFWTQNLDEAKRYAKANDAPVYEIEVPESVARKGRETAIAAGHQGATSTIMPDAEWIGLSKEFDTVTPKKVKQPLPGAAQAGPVEQRVRAVASEPIPEWATKAIEKLPKKAVSAIGGVDNFMSARNTASVLREKMRMQDADRRVALRDPIVKAANTAAGAYLVGKRLPDGTSITLDMADELLGDAVIAQVDATAVLDKLGNTPEAQALIRQTLEKVGARSAQRIPDNWLYEPNGTPTKLGEAVASVAELYKQTEQGRLETLRSSRVGERGLEAVGSNVPTMSARAEALLAKVKRESAIVSKLEDTVIPKEREAARNRLSALGDAISKIANRIEDTKEAGRAAATEFDRSREYVPPAMRTDAAWAKAVDTIVSETLDNGGISFDQHTGSIIRPVGQGGDATGYAIGATGTPVREVPMTGQAQTDAAALAEAIDDVSKEYQDLLIQRQVVISTMMDNDGMARIDLIEIEPNRDRALIKAAARGRDTAYHMVRSTDDPSAYPSAPGRADISAQFIGHDTQRTRYAAQLRRAAVGLSDIEIDRQMALNDIIATAMAKARSDKFNHPDAVYATMSAVRKGVGRSDQAKFLSGENSNILGFFDSADASTLVREHAKALRQILSPEQLRVVEARYGITNGVWAGKEERFANDFTHYLSTSTAPTKGLEPLFASIRSTLSEIWREERTHTLSGMDELFDEVLNPAVIETAPADVLPDMRPLDKITERLVEGVFTQTEKSARMRTRGAPDVPGMTTPEAYRRGLSGADALAALDKAQKLEADLAARKSRLERQVQDLRKMLETHSLPSEIVAAKSSVKMERAFNKLAEVMDDPSVAATPSHLKPLWGAIKDLHKEAESSAQLAEILGDLPQTLSQVFKLAEENGFDPVHVSSFSDAEVRRLIHGAVTLGNKGRDLGQVEISSMRKTRRGAYARSRSVSALVAATVNATHEMHTNALADFIEETYARPVTDAFIPKGWVGWDAERSFLQSGKPTDGGVQIVGLGAPTRMIPVQVKRVLDTYQRDFNHPILNALNKVTNPWRLFLLTLSPRWYVNNFVTNLLLARKEGVSLRDWAKAWRSLRDQKFDDVPRVVPGLVTEQGGQRTLFSYAESKEGFKQAWQTSPTETLRLGAARMRRGNEVVDELARVAVYHSGIRKGLTEAQALQRTVEALVDYTDLTPLERQFVRAVVPFYTWQKGVLKMTAKFALDNPQVTSIASILSQVSADLARDQYGGDLPEAYSSLVKIPGLGNVSTRSFNPFLDAGQLLSPEGIAAAMNPFVEVAMRSALGAPEGGFIEETRIDQFGNVVPTTNPLADIKDIFTSLPQVRLGESLTGKNISGMPNKPIPKAAGSFVGLPTYTDAEVQKMVRRITASRKRVQ